ncbi:MAG: T9SS type A sorting domain-containing protein [Candidatus Kapaibacterium sp.]
MTILIFVILAFALNTNAQYSDVNPGSINLAPLAGQNDYPNAVGDLLMNYNVDSLLGSVVGYGVCWTGTNFVTAKFSANRFNRMTSNWNKIDSFAASGAGTGFFRDLAYANGLIWGSPLNNTIYGINPTTGVMVKTIVTTGAQIRAITWDPVRKGFWCGTNSFTGPLVCYDTNGVAIPGATISGFVGGLYGAAYDDNPAGPYLWISKDMSPSTTNGTAFVKYNATTLARMDSIYVTVPLTSGAPLASGGCEVTTSLIPGKRTIVSMVQGSPDRVIVVELGSIAPAGYFNNFESYTVGQRLACQDSLNWTTWSIMPCNTTEDPLISSAQSFSPTKSVVITQNNDLVKRLGKDSTGVHEIAIKFYVPTGKAGYWNTLSVFAGSSSKWGMECYFDVAATGNNGRLMGGSATAIPFAYTHGAWQTAKLLLNLDVDSAKFFINGTIVHKWKWTLGANGVAVPKKLGGNNFFGATATDEMYVDDYSYMPGANWITGITQNGNTVPTDYALSQNYPNPFNPTTKINFALPKSGLVTMKVYDILGKEVATLVNEVKNAGSYSVDFNASNLTSGMYFYKVSVNGFSDVKKMLMIK